MTNRRDEDHRRRRDRRAQVVVVLVAIAAGVVAALLGTHRGWENEPAPGTTTTVSVIGGSNAAGP